MGTEAEAAAYADTEPLVGGEPVIILEPVMPINKKKQWKRSQRRKLYAVQLGRCFYCLQPVSKDDFTLDHIVPVSRGGDGRLTNKAGACKRCNGTKGDRLLSPEWVAERRALFTDRERLQ